MRACLKVYNIHSASYISAGVCKPYVWDACTAWDAQMKLLSEIGHADTRIRRTFDQDGMAMLKSQI